MRFAFRDDRGLRASITRKPHEDSMTRTGSFPLLNLARDFGLDYGDVLLVAMGYRASFHVGASAEMTEARWRDATEAFDRIDSRIQATALSTADGVERWGRFGIAMSAHASGRWSARS